MDAMRPVGLGEGSKQACLAVLALALVSGAVQGEGPPGLERVRVSADKKSFVLEGSGKRFTPWGFNYDHDADGRLIEDYWEGEWATVEQDFAEMKALGANVVRVHLQFGKFMTDPRTANAAALRQLVRLAGLAERTGLYLDITGLGCYHKKDVPAWYDKLDEDARWVAQEKFWEAVAGACAGRKAVFFYDLMNEPVVPGGKGKRDDWLAGAFGGKHFVQFIALEAAGRPRHEIARRWIDRLASAVRRKDKEALVTVGLVPWSLDRPGLSSGFIPEKVTSSLDFVAVHLYPEAGKLDDALETLKGFAAVGKPVIIEETFPLKCGPKELGEFLDRSREHACGWIGFYWGKTPEEYRKGKAGIGEAITLGWLELFETRAKTTTLPRKP